MKKYNVYSTAEVENVAQIRGGNQGRFGISLEMLCCKCSELTTKEITAVSTCNWPEYHTAPTNALKCISCPASGKLKIKQTGAFLSGNTPFMTLDSAGFVPNGYTFGTGWSAESIAGTTFENIDLSTEFQEYDPRGNVLVSIKNPMLSFEEVKVSK